MIDKIKQYIYKMRYITEFMLSIIFIFFLGKTIYLKSYAGYFHKLYLLGSLIFISVLVMNMIYNFKKSNKKIEEIFLNIAIPIGLCYLIFMIPGHVPDETTHFFKAYDVSKGNIITKIDENGDSYIDIPKQLPNFNHNHVLKYKDFIELTKIKTDYKETEKVVSTAQGNFFIMYIFSALGFLVARILNINIVYGIILGRIFNFIFFLILAYLAIKKIPFGKLILAVYMLTPMNLQQVTSISADAFINSVLLYYIALSVYMIFKKEKLNKKEIALYVVLTAISGIVKMVYILLAGIGFLIIKREDISTKKKILIIALTIVIGGTFTLIAYKASGKYTSTTDAQIVYKEEFNVDSEKQIQKIKEKPELAREAFKVDWYNMQKDYIFMAIGSQLGWIEIKPSETIITIYLVLLIVAIFAEKNEFEFNRKNKIWLALIVVGITLLVEIAMYTGFTPVGAKFIGGVQGRYYIPTYIVILLCLSKKDNYVKIKNAESKFMIISGLLNICVISEIITYFI